jgi:hypothetical protein
VKKERAAICTRPLKQRAIDTQVNAARRVASDQQ